MSRPYNDNLTAEDQVDAEEMVATMIWDGIQEGIVGEEGCHVIAKDILNAVLWNFRRDLFDKKDGKWVTY